jgi:PKD-like domain/Secretion system C-terminal sorting domain/Pregnancy-associated plasma protein-A/CARDB
MKRVLPLLFLALGILPAMAQKNVNPSPQIQRCATQEAIERRYHTDPIFRMQMEQRERNFQEWLAAHPNGAPVTEALTGIVTIPVVVHIVLPNPQIITEDDVEYFINRLNLDFSGLNPDSTNGVPFYGVRGHSLIRFCLARRDPAGNFTNGIERRVGAGNIGASEPQAIKNFGTGGLAPWNTSLYYNVWIGQGGGLLGIAPEIGPGTATSDGVCINYQAFANNPCYTIGAFNLARTAVHEIGHNFGLYHTFQGGCAATNDMGQLTSPGCVLPAPVLALTDDTPAQSASTSGCPTGTAAAGCASSPNPPGKQYQNYMDYTDDACYSMFSNTQVERMHWVTENCRAGYLTSNGCQLPAGTVALDAAISEVVSPGGSEVVGCSVVTYTVTGCSGNFTPKIRIQNQGSATLTSVTVQLTLNGTPLAPQTLPVNLANGRSQVVSLSAATLASGVNSLSFTVSAPNGGVDGNAANNTFVSNATFTPPAAAALPFAQNFTAVTFPPTNMTIVNPNANNTWVRNANGNGNAGSAFIDNYNFNLVGQVDELRSVLLAVPPLVDSIILTFDLAHKNFPGLNDRLQVLVSSDCGTTFTAGTNPVFDRSGAALATAGSSTANYTTPAAGDWRNQRLAIYTGAGSPYNTSGNIIFSFRVTNGYSNNIFLENINLSAKFDRDMQVTTVINPVAVQCAGSITPVVTVRNNGIETVDSYRVGYIVDNGTPVLSAVINTPLAPGSTTNVTLAAFTPAAGNHTIRSYTQDPVSASGSGEQVPSNDTASIAFTVLPNLANISENFVAATFPPANWTLVNPNANNTWVRNANGNGNAGSMFIDNYNFNLTGQTDEMQLPSVNTTGASTLFIDFDLAHKNFPGFSDRLQVLYSTDCGVSWQATSFDRSGAALATAGSSTANYTTPAAGDWVRQTVAINLCTSPVPQVRVAFRATNAYGNNIFLDNISVAPGSPTVAQPANQTVCNGAATSAVTFTGTVAGTTFTWTNNTPSIGLAASGTGNIASFTAVNTGTAPVVATITVTPAVGTCTGTPVTFTITVNPTPNVVATPASQTICTGTAITTIALTSAVSGTTYIWTRNNTATVTGIAANGSGNISGSLTNTTTAPATVTFTITPSANGCPGAPITATVTVNPLPTITCPANITVPSTLGLCTAPVTYTPTATGVPTPVFSYSTTGATVASGSGTGSGLTFNLGVTTVNLTATNACGAASCSFTVTVTDSQLPVVSQQPANRTVCSGSNATFSVTATNVLSYQWQQWNGTTWNNISGATASTYTATNVTLSMNTTSYRAVLTGLCTVVNSNHATLYVNSLPTIALTASPSVALLPNQTTTITATVNPTGGSFVWLLNGSPITGVSGPVLGPLGVDDIGTYTSRYTDPNGCVSISSSIALRGQAGENLWVYPNPNQGEFVVRYYNQDNESLTLNIYNSLGQRILQQVFATTTAYTSMNINLGSGLSDGVYIVEVVNSAGKQVGTKRVIINN